MRAMILCDISRYLGRDHKAWSRPVVDFVCADAMEINRRPWNPKMLFSVRSCMSLRSREYPP